jgi:Spy/CpxP family protein refolding chaperone
MNERPPFLWSRRTWLGAAALAALGLGAAGMATATPGWFGHARHGFGHFRGGPHGSHFDAEDIRFVVSWALREADATDEQVARVTEIATVAHADLLTLHEAHRGRLESFAQALVAADRTALEKLRAEELAAAEGASQRIVTALADAAEVLTPEQRQRLAEAHARHHEQRE